MDAIFNIGSAIALLGGLFFLFVGTLGLLRLPDVYCRLHATTKCDTLGAGLVLLSLALQSGLAAAVKLGLIVLFILITNPTAAHVIARAAYLTGIRSAEKGEALRRGAVNRPGRSGDAGVSS